MLRPNAAAAADDRSPSANPAFGERTILVRGDIFTQGREHGISIMFPLNLRKTISISA
jgi:hypothetical protein